MGCVAAVNLISSKDFGGTANTQFPSNTEAGRDAYMEHGQTVIIYELWVTSGPKYSNSVSYS